MTKKPKIPWPTKAVMHQIYEKHLWGGKAFDFYSGAGSHDSKIINPYLEALITFFKSHNTALTVCDLGCGDFNIGKHLVPYTKNYIAVDIVENLIERNKLLFKNDNLEFHCLDISKDRLPIADCAIIRQVLQHISNSEIKQIIKKISAYKYIIITEHIPFEYFIPNKDIISGQGIRLKQNSGVNLLSPPFNMHISSKHVLHEYVLKTQKGRIITTCYTT